MTTTTPPALNSAAVTGVSVRLRGVRREFEGGVVAVESMDLDVPAGQFIAILGPSGCGKSTLLRLIAGLEKPDVGSVGLSHVTSVEPTHAALNYKSTRNAVAYVFQDAHLLPWRNVLHNVALPLELARVNKSDRIVAARQAIAHVGLSDAERRYPAQLSGGMRMRVSLARALVTEPKLLLLDEPFAALDEITRSQLDEQLRQLWLDRGMTVIFVTHSIGEASYLADRAIVLTRRPARIVLDHELALPRQRPLALRTEPAFARQTRELFEALQRGGQM
jgi:NitT/TauT family transport system ATP-binding protein